ncbi:HNH endonuclease signature motif containing protein [Kocuria sp. UCD-OTCP]|uniref:HNH endonuclease signature motif containing protein n=1 Tax=Kocuria sp. UCD-OTCP TaxID=1292021 RepID=UPI00038275EA|nr:HNH endonuclease signature motif containing protein [Kocuria sp. UCD-OTCP]EYT52380.1 HNH endonuclease [Kocuria sp. UCD-OTCP]
MTATAQRRTRTPVAGEESPARPVLAEAAGHGPRSVAAHDTAGQDAPGRASVVQAMKVQDAVAQVAQGRDAQVQGAQGPAAEVRAAAAGPVEAAAAEARAVGAQVRCIHRLWLAGQAARTAARFQAMAQAEAEIAAGGFLRPDPLSPLAEAEHQLLVDVAAEVGPALRLPAGTARRRVEDAVLLAEMLPEVLTALEEGRIGSPQAAVLVDQWRELITQAPTWAPGRCDPPPVAAVGRLIAELLDRAPHATAAQLRATARTRRAVLVAGAEERARRAARRARAVWVEPAADGTAWLHALLEAPVALAVHDRLEDLARLLGQDVPDPARSGRPGPQDQEESVPRSVSELRADVLADLLLDGVLPEKPGFPRGVRARVSVLVPVSVLTCAGTAGGESAGDGVPVLSGYGPISAEVARQLAAGAGAWHRVLTHPVTGVVLDHDRTVYAVPRDLRRLVELRDGTCRFPGCRRRSEACDLDHTVAWARGGPTAEHNLAALCRHHHRVKHRHGHLGAWSVRRITPGPHDGTAPGTDGSPPGGTAGGAAGHAAVLEWTSPGGLVHRTAPEHTAARPEPEHTAAGTAPDCRSAPATGRPPGNPPPVGPAADPPPGGLRLDDLPPDDPPPF